MSMHKNLRVNHFKIEKLKKNRLQLNGKSKKVAKRHGCSVMNKSRQFGWSGRVNSAEHGTRVETVFIVNYWSSYSKIEVYLL